MDRNSTAWRQTQLVVRVLPFVAEEPGFALKGGTAINLFVRDLPRLSVDIDLVWLPDDDRAGAIRKAGAALDRIGQRICGALPDATASRASDAADALRLIVRQHGVQVKLEVSPVQRGVVFAPEEREVRPAVESAFGYAAVPVVSFADLYAGKLCAALDRQHPRDLFDANLLLTHEGIDDLLGKAFCVYLISHNRPMAELLAPRFQDIGGIFEREFAGMTAEPVTVEELEAGRERLVAAIHGVLTGAERQFLLSFKARKPEWGLLGLGTDVCGLPAVRWKLHNLGRMSEEKHAAALEKLRGVLSGEGAG